MLSLDECRKALGSLADDKSDDEIACMREQAAAMARIVIRTYFGQSSGTASTCDPAQLPSEARDSLIEQKDGARLNRHKGQHRRRRARRRPNQSDRQLAR